MAIRRDLMTTGQCAAVLGVTAQFVRDEIKDGRLRAAVRVLRPSGRTFYRIGRQDFHAYCQKWSPSALERLTA